MKQVWGTVLLLIMSVGVLAAQDVANTPASASDEASEPEVDRDTLWRPPVFDGATITLLEAVQLTLAHNPLIRIEQEEARFRQGILLEASGQFDASFVTDLQFEFSQQSIRESERRRQQESRDDLRTRIDDNAATLETTQQILDEVLRLQEDPTNARVNDPEIQAQIDLINLEIARTNDPIELQQLLDLRSRAIDSARVALQEDVDDLNMTLAEDTQDLTNLGAAPEIEESYDGLFQMQVIKPFRTGLQIAPFYEYSVVGDRFQDKPVDPDFGGKGIQDLFRSRVGFAFDLPLLRGFGRASTGAEETAARIDLAASLASLQHAAAENVLTTMLAYWDLVASQGQVDVASESVGRQEQLVGLTQDLIDADELPAAEMARALARSADARAALERARRSAHEARLTLARVIGLAVDDAAHAPLPEDALPAPPEGQAFDQGEGPGLIDVGLSRRRDVAAARLLADSGGVLAEAARRDRKPVLDLSASVDYNAAEETDGSEPFGGRYVGPSYNIDLRFELPFKNWTQRGRHDQAVAAQNIQAITADDLARVVRINVVRALGSLRDTVAQLVAADEAVRYARQTVDAEIERLRFGEATLIDTLLTEQRLTDARAAQVVARQQYAQLLAQLRFETGTLVAHEGPDGGQNVVYEADLTSAPNLASLPPLPPDPLAVARRLDASRATDEPAAARDRQ